MNAAGRADGDGVLWVDASDLTIALVVQAGVVVAAYPAYAGVRLVGMSLRTVRGHADRHDAPVRWVPGCGPFEPWLRYDTAPDDKVPVRRWRYGSGHGHDVNYLTLGRLGGGCWYVDSTAEKVAWSYRSEVDAAAECRHRMAPPTLMAGRRWRPSRATARTRARVRCGGSGGCMHGLLTSHGPRIE